ncbi:MAG: DNA polymerase III subunit beta [Bdellovibrionota bacterium]
MELSISKQDLLSALSAAQGIVEKRNTMPILSNVLLDAEEEGFTLIATDLEIGVKIRVKAKVKGKGKITIPARKLFDLVRELPDQDVKLKTSENNRVEISVGKFRSQIAGLAADEFPNLPAYEEGKFLTVESKALSEMLGRTSYAVSTDETRYNLNGIYFEKLDGGKKLRLVATDGHRLAMVDRAVEGLGKSWGDKGIIVPRKAVGELKKLLDQTEKIELSFQKNHGIARAGDTVLLMQLIDGEFPKYEQVIPAKTDEKLTVSRASLLASLRRVSLVSDDRSHMVRLALSKGGLTLEADSMGVGEASEELPAEYGGKELTIGFNAKYLADAIGSLTASDVQVDFVDEVNPAIIRGAGEEGALAVIMPMRI